MGSYLLQVRIKRFFGIYAGMKKYSLGYAKHLLEQAASLRFRLSLGVQLPNNVSCLSKELNHLTMIRSRFGPDLRFTFFTVPGTSPYLSWFARRLRGDDRSVLLTFVSTLQSPFYTLFVPGSGEKTVSTGSICHGQSFVQLFYGMR